MLDHSSTLRGRYCGRLGQQSVR